MKDEFQPWSLVYNIMKSYPKYSVNESRILLYGDPDYDDFDELVDKHSNIILDIIESMVIDKEESDD